MVRVTHAINAMAFAALLISGGAILVAHPRFYWGESGYFQMPAAFELPLAVDTDHTGWGRSLHFLAAWIVVSNGGAYWLWGTAAGHFRRHIFPASSDFRRKHKRGLEYNVLQKTAYTGVIFVLPVALLLSGLTMSPAVTAVWPWLFQLFGGRQSARTVHFLVAAVSVAFLVIHLAMVWRTRKEEGFEH
jgi:thiosulfate reductase cytochrome b subunit